MLGGYRACIIPAYTGRWHLHQDWRPRPRQHTAGLSITTVYTKMDGGWDGTSSSSRTLLQVVESGDQPFGIAGLDTGRVPKRRCG
jgi:hypothetical protein